MKALSDFLSTDYGLMSAAVIAFMLGMAGYLAHYFISHMKQDERRLRSSSGR